MSADRSKSSPAGPFARRWIPGAALGTSFLLFPAVNIVTSHQILIWQAVGLLVVVATGALYVFAVPSAITWPAGKQLGLLLTMLLASALAWPVIGSDIAALWIYIGMMAGATLSMRATCGVIGILAGGMLMLPFIDHRETPWALALILVSLSVWMWAFMNNIRLTNELRQTRRELADAAVVAERERIGRDLHDILGHSLTAIAVKAGLARRMVERQTGDAVQEIAGVERLAREALADVRATASGYRKVSVDIEIAVAATVLRAAGIAAQIPSALGEVSPGARELFGYVVREAVTNVVRHSGARVCAITFGPDWVQIQDDGVGVDLTNPPVGGSGLGGSGLGGLCQRVRESGGMLDVGSTPGGGFTVRASSGCRTAGSGSEAGSGSGRDGARAAEEPADMGPDGGSRAVEVLR